MAEDWREKLMMLQDSLPEGAEMEQPKEQSDDSRRDVRLDIILEKKGRGGKQATIIAGFDCDDAELKETAAKLKQKLGTGGSARGGEILIQGDRRQDVKTLLTALGYKARII